MYNSPCLNPFSGLLSCKKGLGEVEYTWIGHKLMLQSFYQLVFNRHALLCESAVLVKGKSFVILYTYFSFKQLMENPLAKEFSLLLKGKCFRD